MKKQTTKRFIIGTILAGLTGYVAGLLTAPKSGKETRKDIKKAAVNTVMASEKQLKSLQQEMEKALTEAKAQVSKLSGRAKVGLVEAIDKTQVNREKVRELLRAIHNGEAEDKDLQKAVKEASKAVQHLQSFFKS